MAINITRRKLITTLGGASLARADEVIE